jgi:hypothetical protein
MYSIDFVTSEKRAHGHRWSYRQRRCARGRLVENSNQRLERRWAVLTTDAATVGAIPRIMVTCRARRLRPRAAALRAHRFCKQGERGATEQNAQRIRATDGGTRPLAPRAASLTPPSLVTEHAHITTAVGSGVGRTERHVRRVFRRAGARKGVGS